jgi:hypothetical protein
MPQNLKIFEALYYAAIALDLVSSLIPRATTIEIIFIVIFEAILAALVWAAARKGRVWAAWLLAIVAVWGVVTVLGNFSLLPADLSFLRPETPPTALVKMLDVISGILAVVAVYFYFLGRQPAVSRA